MQIRIRTLAGMLGLSLLASVTLAAEQDIADYAPSSNGVMPETGLLKNQRDCPAGTTFIKNAFPALTNGQDGSVVPVEETWFIELGQVSVPVTMSITWTDLNSFGFQVDGGLAHIVGVTSDMKTFLYDFVDFYPDPNPPAGGVAVEADGDMNKLRADGVVADDVNHLDLCLAAADTEAPSIVITSPADTEPPATVSGTVIVTATARDFFDVDENSVTATVVGYGPLDQADGSPMCYRDAEGFEVCDFEWIWPATDLPAGIYEIQVSGADGSGNTTTVSVTVELVNSVANCLGILDPNDLDPNAPSDPFGGGCKPTGEVTLQFPPDINLERCASEVGEACAIGGQVLTPDPDRVAEAACDACGDAWVKSCGEGAFPDPRMAYDPVTDTWYPESKRQLHVFDELGGAPASVTGNPGDPILVLDEYTYGYEGCFGVVYHFKNFLLAQAYDAWPRFPLTGLAIVKTYFPEDTWEQLPNRPVAKCYGEESFDLQQAAEFGYQTPDKGLMIEGTASPWTETCGSGRTLTRNKSFDIWNLIETDGIDFDAAPEDVLAFKYQMAQRKFDALFAVLDFAQPTLLTGKFSDVSSPVNQAKRRFDNLNALSLQKSIESLEDGALAIREKTTWQVTEENWPGDALGRIANLVWRLTLLREELIRLEAEAN